ncbi:hypothetical protein OG883_37315 [Streptomyces sp. NBC_01142]|nr:hypothetical protein [Streptomyces sp. NBC_01142]MCX4825417.1 hypothetical protein [Streptomyces sp. NBC_01142]
MLGDGRTSKGARAVVVDFRGVAFADPTTVNLPLEAQAQPGIRLRAGVAT